MTADRQRGEAGSQRLVERWHRVAVNEAENVGHDNETPARLASELGDDSCDVGFAANGRCENLHVKLRGHGL